MNKVTKLMINEFEIKKLGYDFMGYSLQNNDKYTFHHLIIPNRNGGKISRENGAILCGKSSHPYLHIIEFYEYDYFTWITSEMIDMNVRGCLLSGNLKEIHNILTLFEERYDKHLNHKGTPLIKSIYRERNKF